MKDINKYITRLYIEDILDDIGFYPGNRDGEFNESEYMRAIDEIYEELQESKPEFPYKHIIKYIESFYPYNINK